MLLTYRLVSLLGDSIDSGRSGGLFWRRFLALSSFFFLTEIAYMSWRFLSERESERGGGLTNPFVNPEHDVGLEVMPDLICEAFFGMEPHVDFLWWIFTG